MTKRTLEGIEKELAAPIPKSAVAKRKGKGGSGDLSYVEGFWVIQRLNEIFGPTGWNFQIQQQVWDYGPVLEEDGKVRCTMRCTGRLQASNIGLLGAIREDCGIGTGTSKRFEDAIELAAKEAVTDCLKRCARQLGNQLGGALYDKTQKLVVDDVSPTVLKKVLASIKEAVTMEELEESRSTVLEELSGEYQEKAAAAYKKKKAKLQ